MPPHWDVPRRRQQAATATAHSAVGHVDKFVHDSLHTAKNTLFEMEQAAKAIPSGGVMLVDDIKSHLGFETFARRHHDHQTIVYKTEERSGCSVLRPKVRGRWLIKGYEKLRAARRVRLVADGGGLENR